jgi:Family of unknown function (DUF6518)
MADRGPAWFELATGVALAGGALGVMGRISAYMPDPIVLAFVLGVPWLAVSFALGVYAVRPLPGALAGAAVLVVAVATYYTVRHGVEHRAGQRYAAQMVVLWGFFGALTGAAFGLAGALMRSGEGRVRAAAVALPAGALIGEGLLYLLLGRGEGREQALLAAEVALGVALPFLLVRSERLRPTAFALTGCVAFAALLADGAIRLFARLHGWGA